MECTLGDLLEEAVEDGALDAYEECAESFTFHKGPRTFKVAARDVAGFLTALLERRRMELLRMNFKYEVSDAADEDAAQGAGESELFGYGGYVRRLRSFVLRGAPARTT